MNIAVEIMGNYVSIVGGSIAKVSIGEGASVMDLIVASASKPFPRQLENPKMK